MSAQACGDARCARRLSEHLLASLLIGETPTITNLICAHAGQHRDWTAAYRLYSQGRVDEGVLFDRVLDELLTVLPDHEPMVIALDDTLIRKRGTKINGVSWRRDPLGPPFQTNLVRAQRFLQMSAAWPLGEGQARMVPILFHHAPSAQKPVKNASPEQLSWQREEQKQRRLNAQALEQMKLLRERCPSTRSMIFCGDGSYTNTTIVKNLPEHCTYIGRIRKDAKLHHPPALQEGKPNGRPRCYGPAAATPEQLRTDDTQPWQSVRAFAAGREHDIRIKTLDHVLWRKTGTRQTYRVIVIAPLGYRLTKGAKLLYRAPAYLICTDPNLPIETLVQAYLWRWGIEVNFREEKTLLGVGEAHVRTAASNQHLPAVMVAAYALLWTAALRMHKLNTLPRVLARPKWRRKTKELSLLPSTGELLRTLRTEVWSRALRPASLAHFVTTPSALTKSQKPTPCLASMLFCAA